MKKFLLLPLLLLSVLAGPGARAADMTKPNVAVFFEIPVANFDRAVGFYEKILDQKLMLQREKDWSMAFFSSDHSIVSGALTFSEGYKPSQEGTLVYLNGGSDLQGVLGKVEAAGGRILMPKLELPDHHGFIAQFLDSEGNKIGLFSEK